MFPTMVMGELTDINVGSSTNISFAFKILHRAKMLLFYKFFQRKMKGGIALPSIVE